MASTTYFLLLLVVVHVAFSITCDQKLKGEETKDVDCGDDCDFCHYLKRDKGTDAENFESAGCGCGEKSIVKLGEHTDFKDCDGEYKTYAATPEHAYRDSANCCKEADCAL